MGMDYEGFKCTCSWKLSSLRTTRRTSNVTRLNDKALKEWHRADSMTRRNPIRLSKIHFFGIEVVNFYFRGVVIMCRTAYAFQVQVYNTSLSLQPVTQVIQSELSEKFHGFCSECVRSDCRRWRWVDKCQKGRIITRARPLFPRNIAQKALGTFRSVRVAGVYKVHCKVITRNKSHLAFE